jgi:hypothetical protein
MKCDWILISLCSQDIGILFPWDKFIIIVFLEYGQKYNHILFICFPSIGTFMCSENMLVILKCSSHVEDNTENVFEKQ